jgi:predicted NUDIX family NTP pyrophosphohydrolase
MKKSGTRNTTILTFHGAGGSAEILVDQAVAIRIVRGELHAGGPVMAKYVDGAWHVGDQRLEQIAVKGPARIEFQDAKGVHTFGPLSEFSLVGDAVLSGKIVLARYQATNEAWEVRDDGAASAGPAARTPAFSPA